MTTLLDRLVTIHQTSTPHGPRWTADCTECGQVYSGTARYIADALTRNHLRVWHT